MYTSGSRRVHADVSINGVGLHASTTCEGYRDTGSRDFPPESECNFVDDIEITPHISFDRLPIPAQEKILDALSGRFFDSLR